MAKILLVEDDNNLRDIYGERLMAEGYEIISASDGEEALQMAAQQKPDLIISDVMMPKISGFDMLDILRQTPETKDIKIIMMTALSQAEDKSRADKLGADKYLVKSQVTLEDVARVVHDVLGDAKEEAGGDTTTEAVAAETPPPAVEPVEVVTPTEAPAQEPVTPVIEPTAPVPEPVTPAPEVTTETPQAVEPAEVVTPTEAPAVDQAMPVIETPAPVAEPNATEATTSVVPEPAPASPMAEPGVGPVSTPAPDPVAPVAAPAATAADPVSDNDTATAAASNDAADSDEVATPAINPIVGDMTTPGSSAATSTDSSQATSVDNEMAEVAQQIENFVASEAPQAPDHQEPVKEPTEQEKIHADRSNEDPKVVAASTAPGSTNTAVAPASEQAAPVVPVPNPTVPPITPQMDAGNPEPTANRKKVIQPINNTDSPDIHQLYEKEMAEQAASTDIAATIKPTDPPAGSDAATNGPTQEEEVINPIKGEEKPPEQEAPPLETVDANQITGATTNPELEFESADPAQPTATTPPPGSEPPVSEAPAPPGDEPATDDPSDPKNIAL